MRSSVWLIVNPASGRYSEGLLKKVREVLKNRFRHIEVYFTEGPGDALIKTRELAETGVSTVIACGGDGTLNEVVNGAACSETAVGFIASGTTNVFSKEVGLPEEPLKAAERILKGRETFINAGWINRERFFVLMAGVGFDAEAVCSVSSGLKKGLGKLSYVLSGLKVLIKNPIKTIQVSIDGKDRHSLYGIIVCNSSRYAGNFRVCPDASLFSPELHALLIERGTRKDTLKAIVGIVTGKHLKYKGLAIKRGRHFRIEGPSKVQIDGDCYGRLPAEIELRERVVRVIL